MTAKKKKKRKGPEDGYVPVMGWAAVREIPDTGTLQRKAKWLPVA